MAVSSASGSILYGLGPDGELRYIEDVERGEGCGCVCPNPRCGQPLVAKKGDVMGHHFAHKRSTCKWAVEYVISSIAAQVVASSGRMVFPELSYHDSMTDAKAVIAGAQQVGVSSVELVEVSGRGNPDLLVTRNVAGSERRFLALISLAHSVKAEEIARVRATGVDAFLIDLKKIYDQRKREDKHFDREALPLEFQDAGYLASILVDGSGWCMRWLANAKRKAKREESEREYAAWKAQEEKRRKAEEEKRRKLEEERKRELERLRKETARQKAKRETEAARAAEEAARAHEAAMVEERERIIGELDQQDRQVRDSFGNRWVRCEKCGKASTVDEFQSYGGAGRINLGVCYGCGRKAR